MALSTAIFVGKAREWIPEFVEKAKKLRVSAGNEPTADLGPLISKKAKERVLDLVQSGINEGAKLLLDGRNIKVPGYENGNFVGPTILHEVKVNLIQYFILKNKPTSFLFSQICDVIKKKFLVLYLFQWQLIHWIKL